MENSKSNIKSYLRLLRIKHYLKNILIFFPIFFGSAIFDKEKIFACLLGFFSFSLISSCVYIINDIKDVEKDRLHPVKCKRPIAPGEISKTSAKVLAIFIFIISIILNELIYLITNNIRDVCIGFILEIFYLVMNIAYSFGLKNLPIIDVVILVLGFIIRILYGSTLTKIKISKWLYLTVIAGSFYMGFGKRRNEVVKQGDTSREVLKRYPKEFLDKFMYVCVTLTIVFYSLWCVDDNTIQRIGNEYLAITIPIVMIILMKYSLDVENEESYGDPVDVILKDKILLMLVGFLGLTMVGILYLV